MEFKRIEEEDIRIFEDLVGKDRVSRGISNLRLHSCDQSHHKPHLPELVIWPVNENEVSHILNYANHNMIPVTAWGAGTSLEGNPIPIYGGIILDFSFMNKILEIREEDLQADVQPGVIYQDLNHTLRHKGLFFPPDPGARATIGGMIGNNASGLRSIKYGSTRENIIQIRVVLANGEIIDIGRRSQKSSSGYDLLGLFVGAEGTLGIIVRATLKLRGLPEESCAVLASFQDIEIASKVVHEIIRSGLEPVCLEMLDSNCINVINRTEGLGLGTHATLILEFHGLSREGIKECVEFAKEICTSFSCIGFLSGIERDKYKRIIDARYSLGEAIRKNHPGRLHNVLDIAVPISVFSEMVSIAHLEIKDISVPAYIFGHAGSGNLHLAFMVEEKNEEEWSKVNNIKDKIVKKAISFGGTATGEHGVGIGKRIYMELEHKGALYWMKEIKRLFDPNGILNPGKIFP